MNTRAPPLISVAELARSPGAFVLVDCRFDLADPAAGERGYAEGHLPGAVYAHLDRDLSGPVTSSSGRHPLPDPAVFAATLSRWGIEPGARVVVYDQAGGMIAARLWWMLRAIGQPTVQLLDGGLAAWRAAGGALESGVVRRTSIAPRPVRDFAGVVTTTALQAALADRRVRLVDARAADRFAGRNETLDPVAGHVPGAVNHPFVDNLADGHMRPVDDLRARWQSTLAGTVPSDVVVMCGSGVTACHDLVAMAQAGFEDARLYAGSWSEWIRDPERGVETGRVRSESPT